MNLVTGATGHLGNVLVRELLQRGESVRALVRSGIPGDALDGLDIEITRGDVLDLDSFHNAMTGVEVVYHLAAKISLSTDLDPETEQINLHGTRNIILAMKRKAIKKLVFASSIYALRIPEKGMVDESLPFDPAHCVGTYDKSKAQASLEVQGAASDDFHVVLLCPTAVTGPFDFRVSEAGRGIQYHMQPGIKFHVNGAYDFVDVRDVANGFIQASKESRNGEVYILGGEHLSVEQVSQTIWEEAGGWHAGIHVPDLLADFVAEILPFLTDSPIVTPYSLAAIRSNSQISWAKAARELSFHPRPVRQAISDAVRWFLEREKGKQYREQVVHEVVSA